MHILASGLALISEMSSVPSKVMALKDDALRPAPEDLVRQFAHAHGKDIKQVCCGLLEVSDLPTIQEQVLIHDMSASYHSFS